MPGRWSVVICDYSIVLPYGSFSVMSFGIITGTIVVVSCLDRCMLTPESAIDIVCLLGELGGFPILLIKLSLEVLTLILFIISPNRHSQHFLFSPSRFLWYAFSLWPVFLE